jgi:hypothetical protein
MSNRSREWSKRKGCGGKAAVPAIYHHGYCRFPHRINKRHDDRKHHFFLVFVAAVVLANRSLLPTTIPITAPKDASMFSFCVLTTKS